jgi:RNA polymerase sigma-70 factor, ECF subfamily
MPRMALPRHAGWLAMTAAKSPPQTARVLPLGTVMSDEAMLEGLRQQRAGAQAVFFRRYHSYVERLITRVLGFDRDVPDLVQDTFLAALKGVRDFRGDHGALGTWLGQIAIRTARGCIRKRKALRWLDFRPGPKLESVGAAVFKPEDQQALSHAYAALDKLPTNERVVFVLRAIEGMDVGEVCSMLNISPATVKRRTKSANERFGRLAQRDPVLREWISVREWHLSNQGSPQDEGKGQ